MRLAESKGDDVEAGDESEVAEVEGNGRVAIFKGSCADENIHRGDGHGECALLAVNLPSQEGGGAGVWDHFDIHQTLTA